MSYPQPITSVSGQSPQLQKTTTSDHANIIDCFQNVLHVSLMLILFTEIFIVTFINDCAVTTILFHCWVCGLSTFYLINEYVWVSVEMWINMWSLTLGPRECINFGVWQCTWLVAEISHIRQRTLRRPKLRSTSAPHTSSRQPIFPTL